jgi:hypothetical protein
MPDKIQSAEDGSVQHPFTSTFGGKLFKRHDSDLFIGVCERDDGFEILVTPVRSGPQRAYRIGPDGNITDLREISDETKED